VRRPQSRPFCGKAPQGESSGGPNGWMDYFVCFGSSAPQRTHERTESPNVRAPWHGPLRVCG